MQKPPFREPVVTRHNEDGHIVVERHPEIVAKEKREAELAATVEKHKTTIPKKPLTEIEALRQRVERIEKFLAAYHNTDVFDI